MEAALLLADVVGFLLLLLWALRGRGEEGVFGWKSARPAPTPQSGRATAGTGAPPTAGRSR